MLFVGVLPPQLAVCISRLRHACSIAPWVDLYTACMLFEESRWLDALRQDWDRLCSVAVVPVASFSGDSGHLLQAWFVEVSRSQASVRKAIRQAVKAWSHVEEGRQRSIFAKASTATVFFRLGGETGRLTQQQNDGAQTVCPECGFKCKGHRRTHGKHSLLYKLGNMSSCRVCAREFWDPQRLNMHLTKHPACKTVFQQSGIDLGRCHAVERTAAALLHSDQLRS